ncbi:unnamed protein product [Dibothriocephalus latus]|uniref:Uncharacterized protein n=1 Tax=Dibothriocephalus latus TaxID=60516 RepID=A0A3P7LEY5_DIBLA|nr:unnamed protein product [Dibothriocephalus latus]
MLMKWDCVNCQDIFWCGNIDSTSCLIPKLSHSNAPLNSPSKPTPRTLTQRQHSAHGFTPRELAPFDLSLPQDMFTHNYDSGHLIGVFFKRKPDSLVAFHRYRQQQFSSLEEDSDSAFIDTSTADRNQCIPHTVWILRFASKVEASSWLDLVSLKSSKVITEGPCCNGRGVAWLVSELREIFCACLPAHTPSFTTDSDLRWSKVAGHLALIESVHTPVGQITWGLGHDGTPWAFRPDWAVDKSAFSSRKFEFDLQHFQTDCRQVEIYEYQAWRMLKGFSSSRPIGDCQAMWSRDGRRLQACDLTEVQLPSAFCHWQTPWRVDCSCHSEHAVSTLLPLPSNSRDLERSAPIRLDGGSLPSFSSSSSSPVLEHVDSLNSGSDPTLHLPTTILKPKGTIPIPAECPGVECSCDISSTACDEEGWQYASRLTSRYVFSA